MFLLVRPQIDQVRNFLSERQDEEFSYAELGGTQGPAPDGYNVDHNRILLGIGADVFERAKVAVTEWKMFGLEWVELFRQDTPIKVGQTVAILVQHFGFYSLNAARIVYTIDEQTKPRFGFAYGTLKEHVEIGEERFLVEMSEETGEVWYDLFAFSRPGSILAKVGYPLSRHLQKAFARDSKQAMLAAVSRISIQ